MSKRNYGWRPDLPDHRDHVYAAPRRFLGILPSSVDLRPGCPPVYDQGQLGSCTSNAIGAAHQFEQMKQDATKAFNPSRLFIYWNERDMEDTVDQDSGAQIRDGIKSVANLGVCPEAMWGYITSQFATKPTDQCYAEALNHQVIEYQRVTNALADMKGCLASGYPFVLGFSVYESFESDAVAQTGDAPMPASGESQLGGHAVMAVGYDDATQRFLIRNSWGEKWGNCGYFTLPYEYLTNSNLSDDFWTIRIVEVAGTPSPVPTPIPTTQHSWWWHILHPFGLSWPNPMPSHG